MGAIWGAVRGRGRFDLVGDLVSPPTQSGNDDEEVKLIFNPFAFYFLQWPTLLLYAGLHAAQYFAFFVALGGLSPLR